MSFDGKMSLSGKSKEVHCMLIGDALIISENKKTRKVPIKVICLSGLNVKGV